MIRDKARDAGVRISGPKSSIKDMRDDWSTYWVFGVQNLAWMHKLLFTIREKVHLEPDEVVPVHCKNGDRCEELQHLREEHAERKDCAARLAEASGSVGLSAGQHADAAGSEERADSVGLSASQSASAHSDARTAGLELGSLTYCWGEQLKPPPGFPRMRQEEKQEPGKRPSSSDHTGPQQKKMPRPQISELQQRLSSADLGLHAETRPPSFHILVLGVHAVCHQREESELEGIKDLAVYSKKRVGGRPPNIPYHVLLKAANALAEYHEMPRIDFIFDCRCFSERLDCTELHVGTNSHMIANICKCMLFGSRYGSEEQMAFLQGFHSQVKRTGTAEHVGISFFCRRGEKRSVAVSEIMRHLLLKSGYTERRKVMCPCLITAVFLIVSVLCM